MAKKGDKVLRNLGILALIGIGGYLVFQQVAQKVYVSNVKMKLDKPSWTRFTGQVLLTIRNKTAVSVPIESFDGVLLYGKYLLSRLVIASPYTIVGGESVTIPVNFTVDYSTLGDNVGLLLQNFFDKKDSLLQSFRVQGTLVAGGLSIPINYPIQVL